MKDTKDPKEILHFLSKYYRDLIPTFEWAKESPAAANFCENVISNYVVYFAVGSEFGLKELKEFIGYKTPRKKIKNK